MTKAVLKNKLVKAIGEVKDEKLLEALYSVLSSHLYAGQVEVSDEDKSILDERHKRYKAGQETTMTVDEAVQKIRRKKKSAS
jgi:hypothetical protein